jgi:hypothetical protein
MSVSEKEYLKVARMQAEPGFPAESSSLAHVVRGGSV